DQFTVAMLDLLVVGDPVIAKNQHSGDKQRAQDHERHTIGTAQTPAGTRHIPIHDGTLQSGGRLSCCCAQKSLFNRIEAWTFTTSRPQQSVLAWPWPSPYHAAG